MPVNAFTFRNSYSPSESIPYSSTNQGPHTPGTVLWYERKPYVALEHAANTRRNSKISPIWTFGNEYCLQDDPTSRFWCCSCCDTPCLICIDGSTKSALRHLRKKHHILVDEPQPEERNQTTPSGVTGVASALITTLRIERFRYLLIRWIVCIYISLVAIEHKYFRDLLLYIAPALEPYLVASANTLKSWIFAEFEHGKHKIAECLQASKSRVHLSFDGWTSPFSSRGYLAIVAHYLDKDLRICSVLIALKRMKGRHTGENMADLLVQTINEYDLKQRLGMFICDNHTANDKAIRVTLGRLRPDIEPDSRRVRCLGHIVNLAARAFIFGKNVEAFEVEVRTAQALSRLEKQQKIWREKGAVGKIHNTCIFIRDSSQRREAFLALSNKDIGVEVEG